MHCDSIRCEQTEAPTAVRQNREDAVYKQAGCVCVPLLLVWADILIQSMCGNVQSLREALLEDSRVQLDAGGEAIMLADDLEEMDEEKDENTMCSLRSVDDCVEEDWESDLS